jgi:hypothetical protein
MNSIIKYYLKSILYQVSKPILGRVGKFHGIHKRESCYIFGDGVSVKHMDLALFSDKTSIALNYFPFHKEFSTINCLYCVINAPYFFSPFFGYPPEKKRYLYEMSKIYKNLIVSNPQINYFINLSNYPFVRDDNVFHTFRNIPDNRLSADFIGNRINCFTGVNRVAMMLAIYMGFDHIYLVGCDYTHVPSRSLHWYEKGQGVFYPIKNYQKDFFEIAKEFIDITTITLDGTSDFINAVTYKEHTGCEPIYRENTELVDEKYLKALSTWSGNNIY